MYDKCTCPADRCRLGVDPPWYRDDRNEQMSFNLFAMNQERKKQIEKVISYLAASADPNDFATQCAAYDYAGIDSDSFEDDEVKYIEKEVARKFCR